MQPTADSRARLATHRVAELMGCSSASFGEGKHRFVKITLKQATRIHLSENEFDEIVGEVLADIFPRAERRKMRRQKKHQKRKGMYVEDAQGRLVRVSQRAPRKERMEPRQERRVRALEAPPLTPRNTGYGMLERMGWEEGSGLGVGRHGRTEPVMTELKSGRGGLGS